jgi:hypothetical protein
LLRKSPWYVSGRNCGNPLFRKSQPNYSIEWSDIVDDVLSNKSARYSNNKKWQQKMGLGFTGAKGLREKWSMRRV